MLLVILRDETHKMQFFLKISPSHGVRRSVRSEKSCLIPKRADSAHDVARRQSAAIFRLGLMRNSRCQVRLGLSVWLKSENRSNRGDFIMDVKKDNAMYMHIAQIASERSYAVRLKVGCVIVKNNAIISIGWNGMPTGYDNCCEMQVDGKLVTRPEVQHAELNAISKLAFNGFSSRGASIFITHSPCIHCALLIQKCGIEHVYYHEIYRDDSGIRFLQHAGIDVEQL